MINAVNGIDWDQYAKLRDIQRMTIDKIEFTEHDFYMNIHLSDRWGSKKHLRLWTLPDCCAHHYFTCDDDLSPFIGAAIDDFEVRDQPDLDDGGEVHEVSFLIVTTSKGQFTVAAHNEHNGYYGGITLYTDYV
jgi:hypothetical protein